MKYRPELDGLRAIAALAVVGRHSWSPFFQGGFLGVDVFFVLSGFLITRVLTDNPDLPHFYWRRAKRLIPPLSLMLVAYLAVFAFLVPGYPHGRDALLSFLYLTDLSDAFVEHPKFLGHTWSLSVEEHFYLLWPLIFLRAKPSVGFLCALFVVATAWRWWYPDWRVGYFRFDLRLSGIILGCILAQVKFPKFPAWPGLLAIGLLVFYVPRVKWGATGPAVTVAEIAAAAAILGTPPQWLKCDLLTYLGKLSYGIYLWHVPISSYMHTRMLPWGPTLLVSLLLSVLFATLSYHTLEAFFRQRRGNGVVGAVNAAE